MLSDYSECSECSDLSKLTQIQRDSTRRLFVEICVNSWFGFKITNFTNHTNIFWEICGFVESCGICVSVRGSVDGYLE